MAERGDVLAVDIGTSATKAVLFDGQGRILSLARRAYAMLTPRPDWAEQDPEAVYPAVLEAIREAYQNRPPGRSVDAVAFSAQWYSTMPVASDDRALCTLSHLVGPSQRGHRRSPAAVCRGAPDLPGHRLPAGRHLPPLQDRLAATGRSSCSAGSFSLHQGIRLPPALRRIRGGLVDGLVHGPLRHPPAGLVSGGAGRRRHRPGAPLDPRLSLPDIHPLVAGGAGTHRPAAGHPLRDRRRETAFCPASASAPSGRGIAAVNVGTSAACRYLIEAPTVDPQERLWTYALDERWWVIGGIVSSGGIVYDWFVRQCADAGDGPPGVELHAALNDLAAQVPAGCGRPDLFPVPVRRAVPRLGPRDDGRLLGAHASPCARAPGQGGLRGHCPLPGPCGGGPCGRASSPSRRSG